MLRFFSLVSIAFGILTPLAAEAKTSCGHASFYGSNDGFAWQTMANGRPMNPQALTTAHRYLPLGTRLRVTNPANGKSITVTVSDRGPYYGNRVLDLSYGAFSRIAAASTGVAKVCFARL